MADAKAAKALPTDAIARALSFAPLAVNEVINRLRDPEDYRTWFNVHPVTRKSARITSREDAEDFDYIFAIVKHPAAVLEELSEKIHQRQEFEAFSTYLHKQAECVDAELKEAVDKASKLPRTVRRRRWGDLVTCVYAYHLSLKGACEACGCKQTHVSPV